MATSSSTLSAAVWFFNISVSFPCLVFQYFRFLFEITTKAKQLTIVVAAPAPSGQQPNKQQIKV